MNRLHVPFKVVLSKEASSALPHWTRQTSLLEKDFFAQGLAQVIRCIFTAVRLQVHLFNVSLKQLLVPICLVALVANKGQLS